MSQKDKILKKALKFVQKGAYDKAVAEYRSLIDMDSDDVSLRLRLGDLFVKTGRLEEAVKEYTSAAKYNARRGFYLKAIAVYKRALTIESGSSTDTHYKLAELYTKQRLIADAMSQYTIILNTFEQKGMDNEELDILKKMVELDPSNLSIKLKLADMYRKLDFLDDALEVYRLVCGKLFESGNLKKAEDIYLELYGHYPEEPRVLTGLMDIYREKGEDDGFIKYASSLLRLHVQSGELEEALGVSKAILSRSPDHGESLSFIESYGAEELSDELTEQDLHERDEATGVDEVAEFVDDLVGKEVEEEVSAEQDLVEQEEVEVGLDESADEDIEISLEGFECEQGQEDGQPVEGEQPSEEEQGNEGDEEYVSFHIPGLDEGGDKDLSHTASGSDDEPALNEEDIEGEEPSEESQPSLAEESDDVESVLASSADKESGEAESLPLESEPSTEEDSPNELEVQGDENISDEQSAADEEFAEILRSSLSFIDEGASEEEELREVETSSPEDEEDEAVIDILEEGFDGAEVLPDEPVAEQDAASEPESDDTFNEVELEKSADEAGLEVEEDNLSPHELSLEGDEETGLEDDNASIEDGIEEAEIVISLEGFSETVSSEEKDLSSEAEPFSEGESNEGVELEDEPESAEGPEDESELSADIEPENDLDSDEELESTEPLDIEAPSSEVEPEENLDSAEDTEAAGEREASLEEPLTEEESVDAVDMFDEESSTEEPEGSDDSHEAEEFSSAADSFEVEESSVDIEADEVVDSAEEIENVEFVDEEATSVDTESEEDLDSVDDIESTEPLDIEMPSVDTEADEDVDSAEEIENVEFVDEEATSVDTESDEDLDSVDDIESTEFVDDELTSAEVESENDLESDEEVDSTEPSQDEDIFLETRSPAHEIESVEEAEEQETSLEESSEQVEQEEQENSLETIDVLDEESGTDRPADELEASWAFGTYEVPEVKGEGEEDVPSVEADDGVEDTRAVLDSEDEFSAAADNIGDDTSIEELESDRAVLEEPETAEPSETEESETAEEPFVEEEVSEDHEFFHASVESDISLEGEGEPSDESEPSDEPGPSDVLSETLAASEDEPSDESEFSEEPETAFSEEASDAETTDHHTEPAEVLGDEDTSHGESAPSFYTESSDETPVEAQVLDTTPDEDKSAPDEGEGLPVELESSEPIIEEETPLESEPGGESDEADLSHAAASENGGSESGIEPTDEPYLTEDVFDGAPIDEIETDEDNEDAGEFFDESESSHALERPEEERPDDGDSADGGPDTSQALNEEEEAIDVTESLDEVADDVDTSPEDEPSYAAASFTEEAHEAESSLEEPHEDEGIPVDLEFPQPVMEEGGTPLEDENTDVPETSDEAEPSEFIEEEKAPVTEEVDEEPSETEPSHELGGDAFLIEDESAVSEDASNEAEPSRIFDGAEALSFNIEPSGETFVETDNFDISTDEAEYSEAEEPLINSEVFTEESEDTEIASEDPLDVEDITDDNTSLAEEVSESEETSLLEETSSAADDDAASSDLEADEELESSPAPALEESLAGLDESADDKTTRELDSSDSFGTHDRAADEEVFADEETSHVLESAHGSGKDESPTHEESSYEEPDVTSDIFTEDRTSYDKEVSIDEDPTVDSGPAEEPSEDTENTESQEPAEPIGIYTEPELEEAIQNLARSSAAGDVFETYEELKTGFEKQLSTEDAGTHFNLGKEYLEMELFKEAAREFKIALKDKSLGLDCYINLASCSMAEANFEEAIIYYLKVLKAFHGSDAQRKGFLYDLAMSYAASGQEREAQGIFSSIYETDPRFRDVEKKIKKSEAHKTAIPLADSMLEVELL